MAFNVFIFHLKFLTVSPVFEVIAVLMTLSWTSLNIYSHYR